MKQTKEEEISVVEILFLHFFTQPSYIFSGAFNSYIFSLNISSGFIEFSGKEFLTRLN